MKEQKYGLGTTHINNDGEYFEIVEKLGKAKVKIKFKSNNFEKIVTYSSIQNKSSRNNSTWTSLYEVGMIFKTNENFYVEIIEKIKDKKSKIKFLDEYGYEKVILNNSLKLGTVHNPFFKSVFGVGYIGIGNYSTKQKDIYFGWSSMIRRCYSKVYQNLQPTYIGTKVCDEWHNFQNFAKWYDENFPKHIEGVRFQLDKDLLQQDIMDRIYSPETCVFLPSYVNSFLPNRNKKLEPVGIYWNKKLKKWRVKITDFNTKKLIHLGLFLDKDEAIEVYEKYRASKLESVKQYMRDLNYLEESLIQLIK